MRLGTLTGIPNKIRSTIKNVLIRFQAGKVLMLLAITSWVAFTLPIGYIHPPVVRYFSSNMLRFFFIIHCYIQVLSHLTIIIIHNSLSSCKAWNGSRYLLQEPKYTREHENFERRKRWDNDHFVPLWDVLADQLVSQLLMPLKKLSCIALVQVPARRHNATVPYWRPQHRWRPVKSQKVLITHFMSLKFEDYSKHKVCQILWNDIPILLSNGRWLAKRSKKVWDLLCFQSEAGWVLRPQVGPWIYGTIIK